MRFMFSVSILQFFPLQFNGTLEIHDEYWHPHVDRNNTPHYQYSGLLYLSTYGVDFEGGRFIFFSPSSAQQDLSRYDNGFPLQEDSTDIDLVMEPRAGRIVIFSSDMENTHQVERVTNGQRFVLSFWFTCDPAREFPIFLDGNAHLQFGEKMKARNKQRSKQQQQYTRSTEL